MRIIEVKIEGSDVDTFFIFADGCCKQNPGPCEQKPASIYQDRMNV